MVVLKKVSFCIRSEGFVQKRGKATLLRGRHEMSESGEPKVQSTMI